MKPLFASVWSGRGIFQEDLVQGKSNAIPLPTTWTTEVTWTEGSFQKFQNAIFLEIFKIPSMRLLI